MSSADLSMTYTNIRKLHSRVVTRVLAASLILIALVGWLCINPPVSAVSRTWDGGGATNNWSEAANWTGDTVPGPGDVAIFDGSLGSNSLKNCTVDDAGPQGSNISIGALTLSSGYTGIVSINNGINTTFGAPSTQSGGTLTNGDGTITFGHFFTLSAGSLNAGSGNISFVRGFTQNGGTFTGGSSNISVASTDPFLQNAGTFNAPSGSLTIASNATINGTFNSGLGTLVFTGANTLLNLAASELLLHNLTINKNDGGQLTINDTNRTVRVPGLLLLSEGKISAAVNSNVKVEGLLTISPSFGDQAGSSVGGDGTLLIQDGAPGRVITIPAGAALPNLTVNDANVTLAGTGSGEVRIRSFNLIQGVINTGTADFSFGLSPGFRNSVQGGGTFNCGGGPIKFETVNFTLNGGSFNCASSNIEFRSGGTLAVNAGSFNAPAAPDGMLSFTVPSFNSNGSLQIGSGATFNHNNGTISFANVFGDIDINGASAGTQDFGNVILATASNFQVRSEDTARILGNLVMSTGRYTAGTLEARGSVTIENGYTGGSGGLLRISGADQRTITLPVGLPEILPPIELDAPNVVVNTSGPGEVKLHSVSLLQGTIETGTTDMSFGLSGGFRNFSQSGGSFNCGGGPIKFETVNFTLNGGSFNCSSSNVEFRNGGTLALNNGTFNAPAAPSGTLSFTVAGFNSFGNLQIGAGATFNHNNGTVVFANQFGGIDINGASAGTADFFNLVENTTTRLSVSNGDIARVLGDLTVTQGGISGSYDVLGNVSVGSAVDSESGSLTFSGTANQAFTNNGGINPTGAWNVDKTSGTVTVVNNLLLGTSQPLNIKSGTLFLSNNSNLTCGALTLGDVAAPAKVGKLVSESSSTITLGGNVQVLNSSVMDLQGSGVACPQSDTILLRSSLAGTRRNWSGTGVIRLIDVDVKDMGGSSATQPAITVYSGTNSGNNNTNWTFNNNCAPTPSISPQIANVVINTLTQFTAGGGFAPLTFSIPTNNSGATINPSTGLYTAGATSGVTDTVRVTDAFNNTADATVNVFGMPHHLAFLNQPGNTVAGQTFAPLQVAIQDQANATVPVASNLVTISIGNNPGCPSNCGALIGTVSATAVNGIATFNNLRIQKAGTGYTLQVSTSGLVSATSAAFNVAPLPASNLAFVTQPSNTNALAVMSPSIQVAVQDAFGNIINLATPISISLENNPGNDQSFGTKTSDTVNGIATFTNLVSNVPANNYTLRAHRAGITDAISTPYNIRRPLLSVTNTSNSGAGSLKQAIEDANLIAGADTISFNIPGSSPFTIQPAVDLPEITGPVVLDATTQPGYAGSPIVELRGPSAGSSLEGLRISAGNSTVKGFAINNFFVGINITTNGVNTLRGNYIGISANGNTAAGNTTGIRVSSPSNLIGGTTAAARNVISANVRGIELTNASMTVVKGNYLGTASDGAIRIPNQKGIQVSGNTSDCTIGGVFPGEGNVIFSSERGIHFQFVETANRNSIRGNLIRTPSNSRFIDLDPDNTNPNDPLDADIGGNTRQNYPVLSSATFNNGVTTVQGTLNSVPSSLYLIDFYSYQNTGVTEGTGVSYHGSINVSTDSSGIASFQVSLPPELLSKLVIATATDSQGNTSEFSSPKFVYPLTISISGKASGNTGGPLSNVGFELSRDQIGFTASDSNGDYFFSLPGGGNYTVTPKFVNHSFSPSSRTTFSTTTNQLFNFTGTKTRSTVVGIVNQISNGQTLPSFGATVTINGPSNRTTTANGVFVFYDLPTGEYRITVEKNGVVFSPSVFIINLGLTDQVINFLGQSIAPLPGRFVFGVTNGSSENQPISMNADGTAYVQLLHYSVPGLSQSRQFKSNAALSRDGKLLVGPGILQRLSVSNGDGINFRHLDGNFLADNNQYDYSFSPDGTKIAYVAYDATIKIVNTDGTNITTLSLPSYMVWKTSPTWLTNTKIAFSATESGGTNRAQIFSVNIDSTGLTQLTTGNVDKYFPVASPNGSKIAFATVRVLHTMNVDGSGDTVISSNVEDVFRFAWSPDGTKLCFTKIRSTSPTAYDFVAVNASNGSGLRVILNREVFGPSWGPPYEFATPQGSNVNVNSGFTSITFAGVTNPGVTTVTQIPFSNANLPGGFQLLGANIAFEISTTATVTPPITVCFIVPASTATTQAEFNQLYFLHSENGTFQDRTTSRDFSTRTICGSVNSLSPFVLAEQSNDSLPSIQGLVQDNNGNALADAVVELTGTERRSAQTDSLGNFAFLNLTQGGNYNVQPRLPGYLFTEYSQDFVNVTSPRAVVFTGTQSVVQISGRVTNTIGEGVSNVTINAQGPATATTLTDSNGNYALTDLLVDGSYRVVPELGFSSFAPADIQVGPVTSNLGDVDFVLTVALPGPTPTPTPTSAIQFSLSTVSVAENQPSANLTVSRSGDTSATATVSFSTSDLSGLSNCNVIDGIASSRCDYATSVGQLRFDPGQTSKSFSIPLIDDSFAEGPESFEVTLSDAAGVALGAISVATVSIIDNEAAIGANPIDGTAFFVRQQYVDFLNREPDPPGFAAWQAVIDNCPPGDTTCDRIHVSSAFFRSPEFQDRGYFVYRFYSTALGRKPDYVEFIPDLARVSGFLSPEELEAAKVAFVNDFMARPGFANTYNSLDNTQYVDTLLATAGITHIARDFWIAALGNGTRTRAQVLREIAESTEVYNKYFNQAFVVMQYFGYLRRDPDSLYLNWIMVLDSTGDFRGMVNGFMNSLEYRFRFGP